jgi:hypothetical protein
MADKPDRNRLWFFVKLLLGVAILTFLLWQADLNALRDVLRQVNVWVFVSLPIFYVHTFVKAWRWKVFLKSRGVKLGIAEANRIYLAGMFLGLISPGRVGEAWRAWILQRRDQAPLGLGFASVVVDRLCDLIGLTILGVVGLIYLLRQGLNLQSLSTLAASGPVAAHGPIRRFLKKIFDSLLRKLPSRTQQNFRDEFTHFIGAFAGFRGPVLLPITLLTILSIAIYCWHLWFISSILGLGLTFLEIVGVLSAATFINVLPISVNGLGTRDAFLVVVLPVLGVDRNLALGFSLMFLLIFLANTLMSFPFWLRERAT